MNCLFVFGVGSRNTRYVFDVTHLDCWNKSCTTFSAMVTLSSTIWGNIWNLAGFVSWTEPLCAAMAVWARRLARNLEVQGSRLGSCRLPVIIGSALGKLNYWRSTHMFRSTQPTTNWMANEYRAVVTVMGRWKEVVLKSRSWNMLKDLIEPL
jgi:hypothetical protein